MTKSFIWSYLLRLFTPSFFYWELGSRFSLQSFIPLRCIKGFPLQSGLGVSSSE